jgi:hypothetical protein
VFLFVLLLLVSREVDANLFHGVTQQPSGFIPAISETRVHKDITERTRGTIASAVIVGNSTFDTDYFLQLLNLRRFFRLREILDGKCPIPNSRTNATPAKYDFSLPAEGVSMTGQCSLIRKGLGRDAYIADNIIRNRLAVVLERNLVLWNSEVGAHLAPQDRCDICGNNRSGEVISHRGFMSIPPYEEQRENAYQKFPELKLLKKPTAVWLLLLCLILTTFGLWQIKFNVSIQPNAHRALLLLVGSVVLVVFGQLFLWLALDLAGL